MRTPRRGGVGGTELMSEELHKPVLQVSAVKGKGLPDLVNAILATLSGDGED